MARRLPELMLDVKSKAGFLGEFAKLFGEARQRAVLPQLLFLEGHPILAAILAARPVNLTRLESCLREVIVFVLGAFVYVFSHASPARPSSPRLPDLLRPARPTRPARRASPGPPGPARLCRAGFAS